MLGTVAEVSDAANYDPAPLLAHAPGSKEPEGLLWNAGVSFSITEKAADHVTLDVTHAGGVHSTVKLSAAAEGRFQGELVPADATTVAYLRLSPKVSADEAFYGLGEYFDDVNHRGKLRAMQLEIDELDREQLQRSARAGARSSPAPAAGACSSRIAYPAAFDVGSSDPERVDGDVRHRARAARTGLTFHLFVADAPARRDQALLRRHGLTRAARALGARAAGLARREQGPERRSRAISSPCAIMDLADQRHLDRSTLRDGVNTFDFDPAQVHRSAEDDRPGARPRLPHGALAHAVPRREGPSRPRPKALRDEATQQGLLPDRARARAQQVGHAASISPTLTPTPGGRA